MATSAPPRRRGAEFKSHPSSSLFTVSQQAYLAEHADPRYSYIATGALVFDTLEPAVPRVLLLQRSTGDSMPDRWEVPGGGCDDSDESILHAVARELWEEAGLIATYIGQPVGGAHLFTSSSGKKICKFVFPVETEQGADGPPEVKLDTLEHQQFVWANEEEVKAKKVGNVELKFTTQDMEDTILLSFSQIERRHAATS